MKDYKNVYELLADIQQNLKAPKNQYNNFGKYSYRSCEDILEAVKEHLHGGCLKIEDEVKIIGEGEHTRFYVVATAMLIYKDSSTASTAYAREPISKKGMDEAQVTGATSSYARKYALNGLLLIDDTKDADNENASNVDNQSNRVSPKPNYPKPTPQTRKQENAFSDQEIATAKNIVKELKHFYDSKDMLSAYETTKGLELNIKKAMAKVANKELLAWIGNIHKNPPQIEA